MSAAAARPPFEPRHLAALGVGALAALIGAIAGVDPKLAIAAALGLAFVLVAVADLAVGVTIFAALTYVELAPLSGGPPLSLAKVAGLTLVISWIASIATDSGSGRSFFARNPVLTVAGAFFLLWTVLSLLWAESTAETTTAIQRYGLNMILFPIVFAAIREPKHLRWVAAALAGGAALAAAYGLLTIPSASEAATSPTAAGDLNRITGTIGDPNLLASVLVVGLVMAATSALDKKRGPLARLLGAGIALLCMLAVFATVSRGGVVALAAALLGMVVVAGRRRGQIALAVATLVVVALTYFALFASDAQKMRLTDADGGSGRTDIWRVGWRMVEANPLHGVGAGNFSVSSIHYLLIAPGAIDRSDFIVDTPAVAHNIYLELLAELGIPGLTLFLLIAGLSLAAALRAIKEFERLDQDSLALIARGVAVGLFSTFAADVFLAAEFSKLLWLLLSLGPAMLALAARMSAQREQVTARPQPMRAREGRAGRRPPDEPAPGTAPAPDRGPGGWR